MEAKKKRVRAVTADAQQRIDRSNIKRLLKYFKISQAALAKRLGIPVGNVRAYLSGKQRIPNGFSKKVLKAYDKEVRVAIEKQKKFTERYEVIEPKIKPLVDVLNRTKLLVTFSSCQGHFARSEQRMQDRNFADVRFQLAPAAKEEDLQMLLEFVISEVYHRDPPVFVDSYKKYIPQVSTNYDGPIWVIQITPHRRLDSPQKKRQYTDQGISVVVDMVKKAIGLRESRKPLIPYRLDA